MLYLFESSLIPLSSKIFALLNLGVFLLRQPFNAKKQICKQELFQAKTY